MTTKPTLCKILNGIIHIEEDVANQENEGKNKPTNQADLQTMYRRKVNIRKTTK
jgi:hypothetical protein